MFYYDVATPLKLEGSVPELRFPTSAGNFESFRDRIRMSPTAIVDLDWVERNLAFSQRSNAAATYRWLIQAGFVDESGSLTDQGMDLLADEDSDEYRTAAGTAIRSVLGDDFANSILAGTVTAANLKHQLRREYEIGESTVNKAINGLAVLAEASAEKSFMDVFGPPRRRQASANGSRTNGIESSSKKKRGSQHRQGSTGRRDLETAHAAEGSSEEPIQLDVSRRLPPEPQGLLSNNILTVTIDGTWNANDAVRVLRALQQLEMGVPIERPDYEESDSVQAD